MNVFISILSAALIGGTLCLVAQLLLDLTALTPARILVLYVVLGVFLYSVGAYDFLFNVAGAGASLPLIGFGAAIGKGVKEAINAEGLLGIIKGGLSATAGGITVALVLGLLASLFTKGHPKRM